MSSRKLLEALGVGQPINGDEGGRVLSHSFTNAISPITLEVVRSRGLKPSRVRKAFWITGRPGNGKTQSLRQLTNQLPQLEGAGKYSFAIIDFDKEPAARQPEALVPTIIRRSLSGGVITEVQQVRDEVLRGSSVDNTVKESVSFGVDVISGIAQLPPISLFAAAGVKQVLKFVRAREWYIRRKLREKWSSNPQLMELLCSWVRYVLKPNTEREEEFSRVLRRLSGEGSLFDLFCFALENAGYSTMVLIFDEVDRVALDSLKPLWDPTEKGEAFYHELNLIMVLSSTDELWQEANADEVLGRRFCRTENGHQFLPGPRLNLNGNDDMDHVVRVVTALTDEAPHLRRPIGVGEIDALRRQLLQRNGLTWQVVWERVIASMVNL